MVLCFPTSNIFCKLIIGIQGILPCPSFLNACALFLFNFPLCISASIEVFLSVLLQRVFSEDVTFQHPLFVNNSIYNHYFTNYSTYNRSVSTNDQ